jgi:cytochrome P450
MDLFSDETRRNPFPIYDQLRSVAPVFHLPGPDLYFLFGHDAVKRALSDHEVFSSNVGPTRGETFQWLLFMDPPRHTKLRAIISRAFTPRSVAGLEPRIRAISRGLLDRAGTTFDLVADFGAPLPMMVIAEMIGLPADDWRRLAAWSEAIVNLGNTISGVGAEQASQEFTVADEAMGEYFGRLIDERRARPADDLVTRLVSAEVDGSRLDDREIVRFCQLLLAAGTETTTNLIDNAVISFIEHPAELARLRADRSLLPSAIEEVLRYRTPVQAMFRATARELELDGTAIPANKLIVAVIGAANRDPRRFPDPHRFDIAREPNAHVAFGHGIHFCLGAPLSRLEARIALGDLLERFSSFTLASDWAPRSSFHVHGPRSLSIACER